LPVRLISPSGELARGVECGTSGWHAAGACISLWRPTCWPPDHTARNARLKPPQQRERHDGRGLPDSSSPAARQRDLQHRALSCDGKSSAPRKLPTEGASVGFPARDWLARPSRATRDATLARAGCSGKGHANGWQPSACGEPKPGKGNTKGPGPARPTSDLDLLPPSAALLCTGKQASPGGNAANGEFRTIEQPGCRSSCKQAGSCVELAESALVRVRHGAKRPESCPFFSVLEP